MTLPSSYTTGQTGHLADHAEIAADIAALSASVGAPLGLTPTTVKTSDYSAAAGDFVPVNTTSGSVTVTLPATPADKTTVAVKHVIQGSTNTVTIARGSTDVFNKAGGSTSLTLTLLNQAVLLQYKSSSGIWYVVSDDLALAQLDLRYQGIGTSISLAPTAVKTGAYSAAAHDFVPVDTTAGAVTITLPDVPADKTPIAVKHTVQGGTNTVTIAASGAGRFNKAAGSTTLTLTLLNQAVILQYDAILDVWYVLADDLALAQLDLRYLVTGNSQGLWYLDGFTGTDDAKMVAALAAWNANALGGKIMLPARALTFSSKWTITNDGAGSPVQKALEIEGAGGSFSGSGSAPNGGTIVDFTYAGRSDSVTITSGSATVQDASCVADDKGAFVTHANLPVGSWIDSVTPGVSFTIKGPTAGAGASAVLATASGTVTVVISHPKIDTRGHGLFNIHDLTLKDSSGGSVPFFRTTNTTPIIERVRFHGSKSGTSCDQDAIILGGGTRTSGTLGDAKFDGYKPIVRDCFFTGIRRCIWMRPGCNDGLYEGNTIWSNCGSTTTLIGGIDLIGDSAGSIVGNIIRDNTIETTKYPRSVLVGAYAKVNYFLNNGLYDSTVTTVVGMYLDTNADFNWISEGYSDDQFPYVDTASPGYATCTHISGHASKNSVCHQPWEFASTVGSGGLVGSGSSLFSGGASRFTIQPAAAATAGAILARVLRSAAEASNAGASLWSVRNDGGALFGDVTTSPSTPASGAYLAPVAGKVRFKPAATEAITGSSPMERINSVIAALVAWGTHTDGTTTYTPAADVLASYVAVRERGGQLSALTSGSTRVLFDTGSANPLVPSGNAAHGAFYFDPADYAVVDHTTYMRLRLTVITNDVAPSADFTLTLKPFTSPAGGAAVVGGAAGSAVTGSSVAVTAPLVNSLNHNETADFAVPAAGFYVLCIGVSANMTASSSVAVRAIMQIKNV